MAGPGRRWYRRKRILIPIAVVLVLVGLAAWLVPNLAGEKGEAEGVVRAFLENAAAGRAELAVEYYSSTAGDKDELAESIRTGQWKVFEGFKDISISEWEINISTGGSSAYFFGSVISTDGSRPFEAFLVKESNSWKIVAFRF